MSPLGHVWTAPWQELSDVAAALVGCGHVSGLFVRRIWPLALMLCADRVPIESTHFKACENSQPPDYIPALSRCAPSRLVKPHCLQECSRPRRGVVCPPTQTLHRPHGTDVLSLFRVVRRC